MIEGVFVLRNRRKHAEERNKTEPKAKQNPPLLYLFSLIFSPFQFRSSPQNQNSTVPQNKHIHHFPHHQI
ncbi:hypothetical protein AKJ16_DCAP10829 [Drosera capensis]